MPSLKAIRTRIASVKSTQKITRAMKLVAAARMRRAQESIVAARPYAKRLGRVISEVALPRAPESAGGEPAEGHGQTQGAAAHGAEAATLSEAVHPLLDRREPKNVLLLVLTSDRGLCGAFNTQISRRGEAWLRSQKEAGVSAELFIVGRKGREYFRRRKAPIAQEWGGVASDSALERAREVTRKVIANYTDPAYPLDAVYMVYNEFKSAIAQKVVVETLLPVEPPPVEADQGAVDFLYEPDKKRLLGALLPLHIEVQIYRALLESIASEFGARMTAMDSATKNAGEMVSALTLSYNRARQASITKELMEIISGAESIK